MSEPTWELLGGGGTVGGPIDFVGTWAAGTQYGPGQVVRHNGIDYLAVNPSLGQTPPAAGTVGIVPTPVNGQWLKGVGGAAIWSAITAADITGVGVVREVGTSGLKAQIVPQRTVSFAANDGSQNSQADIILPVAWPNAHVGFALGYIWPMGHWGFTLKLTSTNGLGSATIMMNQAGGAQQMVVGGVSFGY